MEGTLSELCETRFHQSLRLDINNSAPQVVLLAVGENIVRATVTDSLGNRYGVTLELEQLFTDELGLHCSCSNFRRDSICRHAWSTICQLEAEYHLDIPNSHTLSTYRCDSGRGWVGEPLRRRRDLGNLTSQTEASGSESWQTKLMSACQDSDLISPAPVRRPSGIIPETCFWFAICLSDLATETRFQIRLFQSNPTKGGGWSIPTTFSVSKLGVSTLRDADQRRIFSLMKWNELNARPQYGYYRGDDNENHSSFGLTTELLREALPALGQTERFVRVMAAPPQPDRLPDPPVGCGRTAVAICIRHSTGRRIEDDRRCADSQTYR